MGSDDHIRVGNIFVASQKIYNTGYPTPIVSKITYQAFISMKMQVLKLLVLKSIIYISVIFRHDKN